MSTSYSRAKAKYERKSSSSTGSTEEDVDREYRCAAAGCFMAGAIYTGSGRKGWCGYHHGKLPDELPRVTSVMSQHHVLRDAIVAGRRVLGTDQHSVAYIVAEFGKLADLLDHEGYGQMDIDAGVGTIRIAIPRVRGVKPESWLYLCERALAEIIDVELTARRVAPPPTKQAEMAT